MTDDGAKAFWPRGSDGQPVIPRRPPLSENAKRDLGILSAGFSAPLPPPRYRYDGQTLEALARPYAADALAVLHDVMHDDQAPAAARVSAADKVLDRGFGKPLQTIGVQSLDDINDLAALEKLEQEERERLMILEGEWERVQND